MKRIFIISMLLTLNLAAAAQRQKALKKKVKSKGTSGVAPVIIFKKAREAKFNIIEEVKEATDFQVPTQELNKNKTFHQSIQDARQMKAGEQQQLEAYFKIRDPAEEQSSAVIQDDLPVGGRIIDGPSRYDSRVEIRALDPTSPWVKKILKNGYSVAVVVERSKLRQIAKTFYQIDDRNTLGNTFQLCTGEAFRDQPVVGTGTAIVIGKRQMLTAGHVFSGPLNRYAVIFGYEMANKAGGYQTIFPTDSVYFPVKITKRSGDMDIAVFDVDRDLNAAPIKLSKDPTPPVNEPIYMIGFPYGLPKKVAANASIISPTQEPVCFYTSLDAFQGNSGSPIFSLKTNEVIGILVSGNVDYHWNGSCNVAVDCSAPYCQGEKAVRTSAIRIWLNYEH